MFYHRVLIFIGCIFIPSQSQSISVGWQSLLNLSSLGMEFFPIDQQALLISETNLDSLKICVQACDSNAFCRIFDFDVQSHRCRIFEGNADTMGSIVLSSSSLSTVGSIQLNPAQFSNLGRPCSFCDHSRYLTCVNSTCQCQPRTYFDGSMCRSQNLIGATCTYETDCRTDANLTCLTRKQCGPLSLQNGTTMGGYSNGTAGSTSDALAHPWGIAVGVDGSLFVSDFNNARVMRLQEGSSTGSVVAGTGIEGNGLTQLNHSSEVVVDASSNIYVSDNSNSRVMLWRNGSSTGVVVAKTTARAIGLAVDSHGNVYVSDPDNHLVTKWAPNATNGTVVAGMGTLGSDKQHLQYPYGLYLDELHSYLYIVDSYNNRIQRYTLGNSMNGTTVAGGNGRGSDDNQLYYPQGVCVSKTTGVIYISDTYNHRIQKWSVGATSGVTIAGTTGTFGSTATLLYGPASVTLSLNETFLYVGDLNNNRVQRFQLI